MVYDHELLSEDNGLSGSGNQAGAEGGRGGMASGATSGGGKANTTGGKSDGGTGSTGGMPVVEGGAPSADGGAGPEPIGGSSGSGGDGAMSGSGGNGGSGGSAGSAGKGGSGGNPATVKCSDHPITQKTTWKCSASHSSLGNMMESDGLYNPPSHLTDSLIAERWSTGKSQAGDEWFEIDFGAEVTLSQVTLQLGTNPNDWPRGYAIRVSSSSQDFNGPVLASGVGAAATDVVVSLPDPVEGRYLLVRQTGVNPVGTSSWWTVAEVLVGCVD